ncbi:MAG: D-alanine--D-alanine ligase family protein [Patescibacteria group bacterium]|jgi:D-alanine-D-alanine ligase
MKKKRVAVIAGGRSGEHHVSLVSGRSILTGLSQKKYIVHPIVITQAGDWYTGKTADELFAGKKATLRHTDRVHFSHDPGFHGIYIGPARRKVLLDVVFPVVHGTTGEDGALQGLMELSGIPFVGSGILGSAINIDKVVEKQIFLEAGFPVVDFMVLREYHWKKNAAQSERLLRTHLAFPVFVKPAAMGSSVGITKAHNSTELTLAIKEAFKFDTKIIIEQGVENAREIEVAVLGNMHPYVTPPGEIIPSNEFYDYDAKYVDGASQEIIPAKLNAKLKKQIQELAREAFLITECRGLARVDFLVQKQRVYINELNTMPGFTSISMYAKLCAYAGMPYAKLLDELIRYAEEDAKMRQRKYTLYNPKTDWHKA